MPLYEYHCERCELPFELLVRSRDEQAACPTCGTTRVSKLLSVPVAHTAGASSLPVCEAPRPSGGCGLPQCGTGRCMGM